MLSSVIPDVVFIIFAVLIAGHIAYITCNEVKRNSLLAKYKREEHSLVHKVYSRVYTVEFLIAWIFISLALVAQLAFKVFSINQEYRPISVLAVGALSAILLSIGLYLWSSTLKKDR